VRRINASLSKFYISCHQYIDCWGWKLLSS